MKHLLKYTFVLGLVGVVALASAGHPNRPNSDTLNRSIKVDRLQIYSDADIRGRFRDLARRLSPLLEIDTGKILEGLYSTAGIDNSRSSTSFTGTSAPIPKVEDIVRKNFAEDDENPSGSKNTKTADQQNASIPSSTIVPGLTGPTAISLNARDRIAEYTELFYETTNLQLLLNRAISDQIETSSGLAIPRVPVIIGVPVAVTTPRNVQGALAEVWVKVTPLYQTAAKMPINVITQIPQERSYNVSTITSNANNLGLGVVTTLLNVGFSQSTQREKLYFVKSYDTTSLRSYDGDITNMAAEFGWQFRPALNNKNITPGQRTVMVALSLPPGQQDLQVEVFAQWFSYDKGSGTIKHPITERTRLFTETRKINTKALSPSLQQCKLNAGVDGAFEARLTGTGFSPDLPYYAGSKRVPVSSTSDDTGNVQLTLSKADIMNNDFNASTMFGSLIPLQTELALIDKTQRSYFQNPIVEAWEQSDDKYKVRIKIQGDWVIALGNLYNICLTQIGGNFSGFDPKDRVRFTKVGDYSVSDFITVSAKDLASDKSFYLSMPFFGFKVAGENSLYPVRTSAKIKVHPAFTVGDIKKTGDTGPQDHTYSVFTMVGQGLNDISIEVPIVEKTHDSLDTTQVQYVDLAASDGLAGSEAKRFQTLFKEMNKTRNDRLVLIPIPTKALGVAKSIVLGKNSDPTIGDLQRIVKVQPLEIPKKPGDPKIKSIAAVKLNHIGAVTVRGDNLDRIKKVLIGKDEVKFVGPEELEIAGDPEGKTEKVWYIVLPASIAKTAGPRTVVFILDDDTILTGSFNVAP